MSDPIEFYVAEIAPLLDEAVQRIVRAPLSPDDKAYLAVGCAATLFGAATGAIRGAHGRKEPIADLAQEVADLIVAVVRDGGLSRMTPAGSA